MSGIQIIKLKFHVLLFQEDQAVSDPVKSSEGTSKLSARAALAERPNDVRHKNVGASIDDNSKTPPPTKTFKSTNTSGMKHGFRARVPVNT